MLKFFRYVFIFGLSISMCGCATSQIANQLVKKPNKESKIGVVAFMGSTANQTGGTLFGLDHTINLPLFEYDKYLNSSILKIIKLHGYQQVSIIHAPFYNPISNMSTKQVMFSLTGSDDKMLNYLRTITVPNEYSLIIVVMPRNMDMGSEAESARAFRYGIRYPVPIFFGEKKDMFFAAYAVLVVDGSNYTIIASKYNSSVRWQKHESKDTSVNVKSKRIVMLKKWLKNIVAAKINESVAEVLKLK